MNNSTPYIGSIYALSCSCEPEHFRYVGLTTKLLENRLARHIKEARSGAKDTPKLRWIRKHRTMGHTIESTAVITDVRSLQELSDFEICTMWALRRAGNDLLNSSVRDGVVGPCASETRRKLSAATSGLPAWNKGQRMSDEQREALRVANTGKVMSDATKAKISNSLRGTESVQRGGRLGAARSNHNRWHVARAVVKDGCALCSGLESLEASK